MPDPTRLPVGLRTSQAIWRSRLRLGWSGRRIRAVIERKGRAKLLTEASLLLAVFFLGTNFVAVKYAVVGVPPLPFVALRFTLAGLLLLGLLRVLNPKS